MGMVGIPSKRGGADNIESILRQRHAAFRQSHGTFELDWLTSARDAGIELQSIMNELESMSMVCWESRPTGAISIVSDEWSRFIQGEITADEAAANVQSGVSELLFRNEHQTH